MNPTKNDLSAEIRASHCQLLNERLADLIDLQLQAKQAHWNVKGPSFIALHQLFDSVAEETEEFVSRWPKESWRWAGSQRGPSASSDNVRNCLRILWGSRADEITWMPYLRDWQRWARLCGQLSIGQQNWVMRTPLTSSREFPETSTKYSGLSRLTCKGTNRRPLL